MTTSSSLKPVTLNGLSKRSPSVMEDRFLCYLGNMCDLMIQLEMDFADPLDAERLARALNLALEAEPILGCRFVEHWRKPYWEPLQRDERERETLVVTDDQAEYLAFRDASIDTRVGPQVKACLYRSATGDRLLLKVAHVVADAGGVKEIADVVSSIYSRLAHEPDYRPQANASGERGLWQVMRNVPWHAYPRIYLSFLRGAVSRIVPHRMHACPLADGPRTSLDFPKQVLPVDRVANLAEYGRAHGAKLNDMILAAFFRALAEVGQWDGKTHHSVTTTVDLRRWHLPTGRAGTITNLSAFEYPDLGADLGDDFEATLTRVAALTRRRKTCWIGLHEWVGFLPFFIVPHAWTGALYRKVLGNAAKKQLMPLAFLTNMGAIEPESVCFDSPPKNAWLLPPPGTPPNFIAGLSGYAGALSLSSGTYPAGAELVESLLAETVSQLPQ